MANKTAYMVNGTMATNMKEVVNLLGASVTKRDILAGEVEGVSIIEIDAETGSPILSEEQVADLEHKAEFASLEQQQEEAAMMSKLEEEGDSTEGDTEDVEGDTDSSDDSTNLDHSEDDTDSQEGDTTGELSCSICNCDIDGDSYATDANDNPICDYCLEAARKEELAKQMGVDTGAGKPVIVTAPTRNTPSNTPVIKPNGGKPSVTPKKGGKIVVARNEAGEVEYPEKGVFPDEKAIKGYIKKLSDPELYEWCELEGVTWKTNEHDGINRMRAAMAMKSFHMGTASASTGKSKKKGKYSDYTTEELVAMALEHDVDVKPYNGDDMRILRMYTIMALKDAGLLEA